MRQAAEHSSLIATSQPPTSLTNHNSRGFNPQQKYRLRLSGKSQDFHVHRLVQVCTCARSAEIHVLTH
jgi:hypothetical protein